MAGFKADLGNICGCNVQIVGATKEKLTQSFERHLTDVHKDREASREMKQRLMIAAKKI